MTGKRFAIMVGATLVVAVAWLFTRVAWALWFTRDVGSGGIAAVSVGISELLVELVVLAVAIVVGWRLRKLARQWYSHSRPSA